MIWPLRKKEISEQGIIWDELNKALEDNNKDLKGDLKCLEAGIFAFLKTVMGSRAVTEPFLELLKAMQEVELLKVVDLFSTHVPDLPNPLPEPITSKINPDCYARAERANDALKQLVLPFIEEICMNTDLFVDEILNMKP